ncbi:hypothetical protein [Granulicella sp. dw_53]|uniref:hypothetical protein n=1 Tax=Granulicella sp. dw_53 TaxID=2719792 RepID=UPI001BD47A0E|nr:hypothetical protein [Granulicella sp. dw_53]
MQRIVRSRHFVKASQLREILIYVTHRALSDEGIAIPEHEIACRVLGRREGFNPNDDNIVRVQAGHLRKKLEQYFATDGRGEAYLLVIPKGAYVPHFVPRQSEEALDRSILRFEPNPESPQSNLTTQVLISSEVKRAASLSSPTYSDLDEASLLEPFPQPSAEIGTRWSLPSLRKVQWYWTPLAFCLGVGAVVGFYRLGPTVPSVAVTKVLPRNIIEQHIFAPGVPLSIVATDSSLVLLQNTLHTDISVGDYIDGQYPSSILSQSPDDGRRAALENATAGRYTSLGDLTITWQCEELAQQLGVSATLRYARYMSVRDFEKGNFIVIGSRRGNPWTSLFEPQLNFALEEDKATHMFHFVNKNPKPGEQREYANQQEPHGDYLSYVDIALIPNLTKTGYVLLLNGSVMDSNEAAAHLILNGTLSAPLLHAINDQWNKAQSIEIFLRVHSVGGAPSKVEVISPRIGFVSP